MVETVDLIACKHHRLAFVESSKSSDERHSIYICEDCGQIMVNAWRDGVSFHIHFHINVERQVMMINRWPTWILEGENPSE
ncbi:MAG TPA: hypothetical protein VLK33_08565 [Terriglobales bacterium]|nr:hypothetical protein [Terriglobales bacterium]